MGALLLFVGGLCALPVVVVGLIRLSEWIGNRQAPPR